MQITESHQSAKADTSGTAKALAADFATLTSEDYDVESINKVGGACASLMLIGAVVLVEHVCGTYICGYVFLRGRFLALEDELLASTACTSHWSVMCLAPLSLTSYDRGISLTCDADIGLRSASPVISSDSKSCRH